MASEAIKHGSRAAALSKAGAPLPWTKERAARSETVKVQHGLLAASE